VKPKYLSSHVRRSQRQAFGLTLRRSVTAAVVVAMFLLPAATMPSLTTAQNLPSFGGTERSELSPLTERKLGEQIMRDIRRDRDYLDDAPVLEYLNNFGAGLIAASPVVRGEAGYDFFFFAVRDPALNAFALPGGFIGVHSGLLLAAQTESELASVLAHEIGHVSQRHIARMLGNQRQDSLIPLASMVLGALAAHASPDAAAAIMMGGQGLAIQRQLDFSRDAEREADRVGLQILQEGGFDSSGMVAFFGRLQTASRTHSDSAPPYLRSHPMTTERIADITARTRDQRYRQRVDSLDFHLIRSRMRVLQNGSPQGLSDAAIVFDGQLQQKNRSQTSAAKYGLALIAFRQGAFEKAQSLLQEARLAAQGAPYSAKSSVLAGLAIDIKLSANQGPEAVKEAEAAHAQFPLSRGIAHQYADALLAASRHEDAIRFLRDQTQLYRQETQLHEKLAKAYAAQGKQALQHMALAESYALSGSLPAAIDQLMIARRAPDASFYDQAMIDAREREFKTRYREEMQDEQKSR
jgi:predicted Zn-dependent protease